MKRHDSSMRRGFIALAVAAAALLAAPLGAAPALAAPSSSPVAKYVALGDSYAAGQGAGAALDSCQRTAQSYPSQIDAVPKHNLLRQPACSGATIADVTAKQLSSLNQGTTLVTVTAGANDLGISAVAAACINDPTMQTVGCQTAIGTAQAEIGSVGPRMGQLISAIEKRSPRATVVVTGYPRLFAADVVPAAGPINQAVDALNLQLGGAVQAMASTGDVRFAPVTFGQHAIGGNQSPWLGFDRSNPTTFMHPTADGYTAYRNSVLAVLG